MDTRTRKILKESPFSETFYFSEENRGIVSIRNDALTKIKGDFLLFVDSDNYLDDQYIEILHQSLQEQNVDIAYCQLWDFVNSRQVLRDDLEFRISGTIIKDQQFNVAISLCKNTS